MLNEVNSSLYSKEKDAIFNIALNVLIGIIVIVLFFEVIFYLNYSGIYVVGRSMEDTLTGAVSETVAGGDYVYINKHAKPERGKIAVVTKVENGKNITIIKRVIALGGDSVKLIEGKLFIKHSGSSEFVEQPEPYITPEKNKGDRDHPCDFPTRNAPDRNGRGEVLEEGYYVEQGFVFLLGDHRAVSVDSREDGGHLFPISDIIGIVTDWSMPPAGGGQSFFTKMHKFSEFDLPEFFGIKKNKTTED